MILPSLFNPLINAAVLLLAGLRVCANTEIPLPVATDEVCVQVVLEPPLTVAKPSTVPLLSMRPLINA